MKVELPHTADDSLLALLIRVYAKRGVLLREAGQSLNDCKTRIRDDMKPLRGSTLIDHSAAGCVTEHSQV